MPKPEEIGLIRAINSNSQPLSEVTKQLNDKVLALQMKVVHLEEQLEDKEK